MGLLWLIFLLHFHCRKHLSWSYIDLEKKRKERKKNNWIILECINKLCNMTLLITTYIVCSNTLGRTELIFVTKNGKEVGVFRVAMRVSGRSRKSLCVCFDNHSAYRHFTCWPGLSGDSVIPWVLITGSIWLPMTVAMIWPWALVNNCGVIGCTWSPWAPPAAWLDGTGLGISGIVPIIWKKQHRENARMPHILVTRNSLYSASWIKLRWKKHRETGKTGWGWETVTPLLGWWGLSNSFATSHITYTFYHCPLASATNPLWLKSVWNKCWATLWALDHGLFPLFILTQCEIDKSISLFVLISASSIYNVTRGACVILLDFLIPGTLDDHQLLPCDLRKIQRDTGTFQGMSY